MFSLNNLWVVLKKDLKYIKSKYGLPLSMTLELWKYTPPATTWEALLLQNQRPSGPTWIVPLAVCDALAYLRRQRQRDRPEDGPPNPSHGTL